MSSKRYPEEFKVEAVRQVTDRSHSVADVARRLGVTTHSLNAWIKKFGPDSAEHQAKSDEQAEILSKIETLLRTETQQLDLRLTDLFDFIGGTSTGAIIASGLSLGMSVEELQALYLESGSRMFRKAGWKSRFWYYRYDRLELQTLLQ